MDERAIEKRAAARAAALEAADGMIVGLGTGTTVSHFLPALARRRLDVRCVATSPQTESLAFELGLRIDPFNLMEGIDLAVDGADQVSPDLWLVKGRGGAHTREKVVAAAASRFIVIVDSSKVVASLSPPVPLEVLAFGLQATLSQIALLGPVSRRDAPPTPDGNVVVDFLGPVADPAALAQALSSVPGVVDHGLFSPAMVSEVLVGRSDGSVERLVRPS
jgi:ribose 5-phosphate isomerase A